MTGKALAPLAQVGHSVLMPQLLPRHARLVRLLLHPPRCALTVHRDTTPILAPIHAHSVLWAPTPKSLAQLAVLHAKQDHIAPTQQRVPWNVQLVSSVVIKPHPAHHVRLELMRVIPTAHHATHVRVGMSVRLVKLNLSPAPLVHLAQPTPPHALCAPPVCILWSLGLMSARNVLPGLAVPILPRSRFLALLAPSALLVPQSVPLVQLERTLLVAGPRHAQHVPQALHASVVKSHICRAHLEHIVAKAHLPALLVPLVATALLSVRQPAMLVEMGFSAQKVPARVSLVLLAMIVQMECLSDASQANIP